MGFTGRIRTTVNGGLVNVLLGAKNPLPRVRADDPQRPFFDANLYLAITVDSNGDNRIDAGDPPLLPRQSIVSPVFAQESGNAGKLSGFGWSDLLDSPDPRSAKLKGDRLRPGSVGVEHLKDGSVTTPKLLAGAVTGDKLQDGAVGELALADGSITRLKIQGALLTELTKKFTGKPESIVRLTEGQSFTVPTNKWALVKASLSCSYFAAHVGMQYPPLGSASQAMSHDAYALSGSTVSITTAPDASQDPNIDPYARLLIDSQRVAEVHLRMGGRITGFFVQTTHASASIYLYPDE